ncbi:response regulator [Paraburkholderia sp. RL18-101-BIB-B]|uniref:response regulator transcription factor n=1 Tax=Paraburkholderia sp. RL18-101-BIB-B TaxID=3031634 RepID=UPI0038BB3725
MDETKQLIVVVEDDAGVRLALQRLLRASGFRTLSFESAEALVTAAGASNASCLVLDVQLPATSGPMLYAQLGRHRPPAVFITAHDGPATRSEVANAGGKELLIKPFIARDLLDAIARAMCAAKRP